MAKLVVITGPQAVGKMTVGYELEKITGLKLFHNHMTIELVVPFFSRGDEKARELIDLFRWKIFEAVVSSDLQGIIFTYMWAFNEKDDWDYIEKIFKLFEDNGQETYLIELETNIEERLKRNSHEFRLEKKPTKRNLEWSKKDLLDSVEKYRLNSNKGEIKMKNYLKIDNTNISPEEVAQKIKDNFNL